MVMVIAVIGIITWTGCTYKKEELLFPATAAVTCDTSNVKYSVEIKNILTTNCYSCHSGTGASGGGNVFNTYADLQGYITAGLVLGNVMHSPGFSPMPKGGNKLNDCDIAKIRTWIRNGALNN